MRDGVYLHISGFDNFDKLNFDKSQIRKAMTKAGRLVTKSARKKVAGVGSSPGEYPGKRSGRLQKSIKAKVSRSGFMVKVAPQLTEGMNGFYPAYLWYGVKKGAKRSKSHRAAVAAAGAWRIAPRGNYMTDALAENESSIKRDLGDALRAGLRL